MRRLRLLRILLSTWLLGAAGCGSGGPPDVVLITVDTLRADHLSAYGYPRPTSPFLDELVARGVLFEAAYATSSHTTPSHASMFLSQYPVQHGLLTNEHPGGEAPASLPRRLGEHGYATAGFPSVRFLGSLSGWFERFETPQRRVVPAAEVVDAMLGWLEERDDPRPFFAWLHFYDVHEWVRPQQLPIAGDHREAMVAALSSEDAERFVLERHAAEAALYERARERGLWPVDEYDARIHAVDAEIRRLYQGVSELGAGRETVWIVTSDHGEGLGSHGWMSHGRFVYHEQLRVPLIVEAPSGVASPGRRVPVPVSAVDFLPSVLELAGAGLADREGVMGRSFVPLLRGGSDWPPRLLYAERRPRDEHAVRREWIPGDVYTVFDGEEKVIVRSEGEDAYFDLREDPLELAPSAPDAPDAEDLARRAQAFRAVLEPAVGGEPDIEIPEELIEDLKALGYL